MRSLLVVIFLTGLQAISASAQNAMPACDGDIAIVRISTITQTGSVDGFMKAVNAHKAWYRSHGFTTNDIYTTKIVVMDKATKAYKYSDTDIMSFHVRPPMDIKRDAAWDAYVKQYRDNSTIKSEYTTCLPKSH